MAFSFYLEQRIDISVPDKPVHLLHFAYMSGCPLPLRGSTSEILFPPRPTIPTTLGSDKTGN
jgi:hypothetical protein